MKKKNFTINVWVHPKEGGDDENYTIKIKDAINRKQVESWIKNWLIKKNSAILTDYRIS